MRVTNVVGGTSPISVQMMLIGLRLLGHAGQETEPFLDGATNSVIATVHRDNASSIRNLEAMNMHLLHCRLPGWLTYNQIGWYGSATNNDWLYYFADNDTIVRSLEALDAAGLFSRTITLRRENKVNRQQEIFEFFLELNYLVDAAEDFKNILRRTIRVALVPPPPAIVFPTF